MFLWCFFGAEYARGASISHLIMRYWDIDERHAFEGDHVILRQGYSAVVDHMVETLKQQGASFDYKLNFAVDRVEYARKTTTRPSLGGSRVKQAIPLSDTCCVTSMLPDPFAERPGDLCRAGALSGLGELRPYAAKHRRGALPPVRPPGC